LVSFSRGKSTNPLVSTGIVTVSSLINWSMRKGDRGWKLQIPSTLPAVLRRAMQAGKLQRSSKFLATASPSVGGQGPRGIGGSAAPSGDVGRNHRAAERSIHHVAWVRHLFEI
jgi:hypothetical protein